MTAGLFGKLRDFLAFVGVLGILGLDWTLVSRIIVGLALAAIVVITASADGHRLWPRPLRTVPAPRQPTA